MTEGNGILEEIMQALEIGEESEVGTLTRKALEQKLSPREILDHGLVLGMARIGEKFKCHEIFLPDVLMAAKAMYSGLDVLKPLLLKDKVSPLARIVIGTVQGDLHDIGKNLVSIMLEGAGFEVIDLGHDVPPAKFVERARETGAKVIGMSALLTTTMPAMAEVVKLVKAEKLDVKTVVGGAPVSEAYSREIGADAYAYDSSSAVETVKGLMR
jgi:5-methyltetrahydrofolate--homocysteine methyltransferase